MRLSHRQEGPAPRAKRCNSALLRIKAGPAGLEPDRCPILVVVLNLGLVWCPADNFGKSFELGENGVGGRCPFEGARVQVVMRDEGFDLLYEVFDAAKRAPPNRLLSDVAKPALHLIEPG